MTGLPPIKWNSDDFDVSFFIKTILFIFRICYLVLFPYYSLLLCCVDVVILVIELFAGQEDV
jgi:hypothetical protein